MTPAAVNIALQGMTALLAVGVLVVGVLIWRTVQKGRGQGGDRRWLRGLEKRSAEQEIEIAAIAGHLDELVNTVHRQISGSIVYQAEALMRAHGKRLFWLGGHELLTRTIERVARLETRDYAQRAATLKEAWKGIGFTSPDAS